MNGAFIEAPDGTRLSVREAGSGTAVVFIHEFGGSSGSFDPQVAALRAVHRCVSYNARGYPPSDVPVAVESYSQDLAADDVVAVLDGLKIDRAHLDRKSTRLNSSHIPLSRMPSSA